jgi:hypothetical protein
VATSPGKSRKELQSAWMVLRLAIRNAATQYAPRHVERAGTLGGQPLDPAQVEPLARRLNEELAQQAGEGEASPTVRFFKNTFRPSDAEKERRNLEKAFNAYLDAWRAQTPS